MPLYQELVLLPVVAGMDASLSAVHHAAFGTEAWEAEIFHNILKLTVTHGWMARKGQADVGFILGSFVHEQAEIITLAVLPEMRRQGIASQLVGALAGQARALQAQSLFLEVAVINKAAMALYQKLGFVEQRLRRNYYTRPGQPAIDALCMFKAL